MYIKELKDMALQYIISTHPNVPIHAIPIPKYSDKDANGLTTCIIDFINLSGGWATRIQSQGQYRSEINRWVPGATMKGTPDIIGVITGRFIGIEVKMKDKQSEEQRKVEKLITSAGGHYLLVRSYNEFMEQFLCI